MRILAIDPGNEYSAWIVYDDIAKRPIEFGYEGNAALLDELQAGAIENDSFAAIEMVASYGMAVGREVFDTVLWIGRFYETIRRTEGREPTLIYRRDVKMHLCGVNNAKDANIRQSLIDLFGPGKERAIGVKKAPGPLYGVSGDVWSALAVAVTWTGLHQQIARAV